MHVDTSWSWSVLPQLILSMTPSADVVMPFGVAAHSLGTASLGITYGLRLVYAAIRVILGFIFSFLLS